MVRRGITVWLGVLALSQLSGCDDPPEPSDPPMRMEPTPAGLYEWCSHDSGCESNLCVGYDLFSMHCSQQCSTDSDCPNGPCAAKGDLKACFTPCTASGPTSYACVEGRPIFCDQPEAPCPDCPCAEDDYCSDGTCLPRLETGTSCSAHDQCLTGRCCDAVTGVPEHCAPATAECPGTRGALCESEADCQRDHFCYGLERGWCEVDECKDSVSGNCGYWGPTCSEDGDCLQYGAFHCQDNGTSWVNTCRVSRRGPGGVCEDPGWCKSGSCVEGFCE